ncbi:Thiol-disulfide isomerase or thioredoxin [Arthrobacter subterraneus]|uniref:Thiol-disulfide isomerase or thioredoxin n=1 Tax=Arthrobacter subterraneus TaxID=335973 RepID=A0A1G8P1A6_9MICC|nr:TlpA disulfide reductase family protein [Arthrobacter subterraneus]SDI86219.1 Thiol-disulfide isomerase or thioredoxin [Arthrobacter subterraneus]
MSRQLFRHAPTGAPRAPKSGKHRSRTNFPVLILTLSLLISGCAATDPLAQQAAAGDNKNYIAGDGSVSEYAPETRGEPVELTAELYDGTTISSADWAGKVTVLNVWYAACAPCRVEAPDLQALSQEHQQDGVQFFGVNIRDQRGTAEAFERNFGITYPSFNDQDGTVQFTMAEYVPAQAVPSTLVLDRQGRVAARIIGLAEKSTLKALIADVAAEQ